jgi:hypothetical protein
MATDSWFFLVLTSVLSGLAILWIVGGYYHIRYYVLRAHEPETWKCQPKRHLRPDQQRQAMRLSSMNLAIGGALSGTFIWALLHDKFPIPDLSRGRRVRLDVHDLQLAAAVRAGRRAGLLRAPAAARARHVQELPLLAPPLRGDVAVGGHGDAPGRVSDLSGDDVHPAVHHPVLVGRGDLHVRVRAGVQYHRPLGREAVLALAVAGRHDVPRRPPPALPRQLRAAPQLLGPLPQHAPTVGRRYGVDVFGGKGEPDGSGDKGELVRY